MTMAIAPFNVIRCILLSNTLAGPFFVWIELKWTCQHGAHGMLSSTNGSSSSSLSSFVSGTSFEGLTSYFWCNFYFTALLFMQICSFQCVHANEPYAWIRVFIWYFPSHCSLVISAVVCSLNVQFEGGPDHLTSLITLHERASPIPVVLSLRFTYSSRLSFSFRAQPVRVWRDFRSVECG